MPGTPVEQIKEKLEVVDFLKGYLELHQAGKNFKARCPFHSEKSPSFMVSPDRQSWRCFGCNLGGDIFTFIMRYENLEFAEALKVLAEKAGVELQRINPADYRLFGLLYDLNDMAKDFWKRELQNSDLAKKYLTSRGLKQETIEAFDLGFAPNSPEALNLYFINAGQRPEDVLRAGLAFKSEKGGQFDRFRGRIMFPIRNNLGKIVGFTGRILPEFDNGEMGKYVNSPETPIFVKSKVLYGFEKAKDAIREARLVYLVEGQMDMIMSWQSGIKNVVASSGTALTPDHLIILKRLSDQIVISFDNDEAGLNAGERAIDLCENMDFNVKVVVFKDFKDAAEAAQAGEGVLKDLFSKSIPAPKFYFERYLKKTDNLRERSALNNLRIVLAKVKNIASPVEQNFWLKELSTLTGIGEKTLIEETEKLAIRTEDFRKDQSGEEKQKIIDRNFSRWDIICQRFLSALYEQNNFAEAEKYFEYLRPEYQAVFNLLKKGEKKSNDPNLDFLIDLVMLRPENFDESEIPQLKNHLFKEYLKEKRQVVSQKVKQAEGQGDESALKSALAELNELNSLLSK